MLSSRFGGDDTPVVVVEVSHHPNRAHDNSCRGEGWVVEAAAADERRCRLEHDNQSASHTDLVCRQPTHGSSSRFRVYRVAKRAHMQILA